MNAAVRSLNEIDSIPDDIPFLRISAVSGMVGISPNTIRRWERRGLLTNKRNYGKGQHRYFSKNDVRILLDLKKLRDQKVFF